MSRPGDSGQRTSVRAPLEVRVGRAAVVAFALFLISQTFAHYIQNDPGRAVPAVILGAAVVALYAWAAMGARGRRRWWIAGAMSVLVYAPLPLLGEWWAISGVFLAATALGFLSRRWALPAFALVLVVELPKSLALGDTPAMAMSWILIVAVASILLAALTRFAETARVLYETRAELVAAEVAAQRVRAMGELEGILGSRLDTIARQGFAVLGNADGDAETVRKQLRGMLDVALEAQREMREFAHRGQHLT
ncbi:hypothetical protein FDA94_09130 [Herbidospora galbida]|uniref:Histidine kinase n=1 Tax=Herbidospora galbida TaxID=2575442 RepID=A0A4V5UZQ0_9ACTN|nr:hypothetical protein [Herbidospora galbida]TKK89543.1 hypothetical protein FDA94_09130 [Herbidospora galbida]